MARGEMVSLSHRRKSRAQATERGNLVLEIRSLLGALETYLSETLAANFTDEGCWLDLGRELSLEELRALEARLRGIEAEVAALRDEEVGE